VAQVPPITQKQFGPINLYGNPIDRPDGSASLVRDFRVMPGNWLRLRSGRIAKRNLTSAWDVLQIQPVSISGALGSAYHLAQITYSGSDSKIVKVMISTGGAITFDETGLEQLVHAQYTDLASRVAPIVNLPDSVIFGNGYGYIDEADNKSPKPFLTQISAAGVVRYFGLAMRPNNFERTAVSDPPAALFYPSASPPSPAPSGSAVNQITTSVTIHIGLYNATTGHYSNTYDCGTLTASGGAGYIRINRASSVNYATHGSTETAELFYVAYATLDGFQVPYLILKSDLSGPLTTAVGSTYFDLNVSASTDNGWVLDLTKRAPYNNYPPRQMSATWYTNGRTYGILYEFYDQPGYTAPPYVTPFAITDKDMASVCWSEAEGSSRTQDFVGDPLQSWPPNNISPVPSGERPLAGTAAPNNIDSIVWTATHTFLLTEQADGIHEWTCIADSHGLYNVSNAGLKLFKKTRHGIMWVTQRKQIAIYKGGEDIEIVSQDYDPLLKGQTPTNSAYFYDPVNFVDRFQVYWSNGSVIHDFHTGGYLTTEPHEVRAGAMIATTTGDTYLVIAAGTLNAAMGFFAIEGLPDQSYAIPRVDQLFTGTSGQTTSTNELPEGIWLGNWEDFEDILQRKEMQYIHLLGDGALSSTLSGYPMRTEFFSDFSAAVAIGSGTIVNPAKEAQSLTDRLYIYKISNPHHRWWKINLRMRSHYADGGGIYFADPSTEGDLSTNFYGSIMAMLFSKSDRVNYK